MSLRRKRIKLMKWRKKNNLNIISDNLNIISGMPVREWWKAVQIIDHEERPAITADFLNNAMMEWLENESKKTD